MPDHRFPLQMEALALAVQSAGKIGELANDDGSEVKYHEMTKLILQRASAFLGWTQSTTPTRKPNEELRPRRGMPEVLGDPTESPVR